MLRGVGHTPFSDFSSVGRAFDCRCLFSHLMGYQMVAGSIPANRNITRVVVSYRIIILYDNLWVCVVVCVWRVMSCEFCAVRELQCIFYVRVGGSPMVLYIRPTW